ncbi:MAG: substrate-binding domain-containing protein, partial [Natronospirillum sp.]
EAMTFLLSQHPEVVGVFAINDPSAMGAAQAARLGGRDDIVITSVDGSEELVRALAAGHTNLIATAAQAPQEMAQQAIGLSLERLGNPLQARQVVRIPTHLITQQSLLDATEVD